MLVARVTVLVWAVHKPTAVHWVVVVLAPLRIPVVAVAAIGVVGLLVILRNLLVQVMVVIQVVAVVPATRRLKLQFLCTRRVTKQVLVHFRCPIR
jgi:threonine dehydrogenase-like Zn-dependent dehydrogenase